MSSQPGKGMLSLKIHTQNCDKSAPLVWIYVRILSVNIAFMLNRSHPDGATPL